MFNLISPCKNCPFRTDIPEQKGWLHIDHAKDIYKTLVDGKVFVCHKTTNHDYDVEDEDGNLVPSGKLYPENEFCAGALILMENEGIQFNSHAVRSGIALGLYDRSKLRVEGAPVFSTGEDFIKWHGGSAK